MAPPKHRPWLTTGAAFQIGLRPMGNTPWLDIGVDYQSFMAEKRARMAGQPPLYYRSLPQSHGAQAELRDWVIDHLVSQHGAHFAVRDGKLHCAIDGISHDIAPHGVEPLAALSNMIEEDFILIQTVDGRDMLTAAANAFTTSGRIVASVGQHMPWAHEPVPRLNAQLGPRIDRIIANVKEGAPVERFNWAITPIGSRLFPDDPHAANLRAAEAVAEELSRHPERCGGTLWLRSERQTLLRLPHTGAIAFSIYSYSDPLDSIADAPESLAAIATLLEAYHPDRLRYAAMTALREPVLKWIASR